jgi:hypothetical protein
VSSQVLADCPHSHVVFSIPKMFRILFLFHRELLGELARCAWKAIQQYFEACASKGLLPAGILSIQTAGDFLNWNPHIHALIACAVFHPDGSMAPVALLQANIIQELFEANVFRLLVKKELIGKDLITKMRSWKHTGFQVYAGPQMTEKQDILRVGLYIIRPPASASRLLSGCSRKKSRKGTNCVKMKLEVNHHQRIFTLLPLISKSKCLSFAPSCKKIRQSGDGVPGKVPRQFTMYRKDQYMILSIRYETDTHTRRHHRADPGIEPADGWRIFLRRPF